MAVKKTIAIMGATGAQGGGLARAILNDPKSEFRVRAITRNKSSQKTRELIQMGAEVVEADADNYLSLQKAFKGAYGAYCVTFYWEHMNPEIELRQAENMARSARHNELEHVIWSTLEDTRQWIPLEDNRMPTLMDKYKVPHFDAKGEANRYFAEQRVPTTYMLTSFYWDNFIHFGMAPTSGPDGVLTISFPMGEKPLPGIASEDIGRCAYGIFKKGGEYIGKTVGIAGEFLTGEEMAESFTRVLGKEVRYKAISPDEYRGLGFPGSDDLGNMFQFNHDFNDYYCDIRNLEECLTLYHELQTFDDWLKRNKDRLPLESLPA